MSEAKPFVISKWEVWEAYKRRCARGKYRRQTVGKGSWAYRPCQIGSRNRW